jgi:hypothetical protein
MLQTVASLIDDARVIIYNCNMFIMQATELTELAKAKSKGNALIH